MAQNGAANPAKSAPSTGSGGAASHRTDNQENYQQWFGTVFTNEKAGMTGVNKEFVKKIVYEMSKVCSDRNIPYPRWKHRIYDSAYCVCGVTHSLIQDGFVPAPEFSALQE